MKKGWFLLVMLSVAFLLAGCADHRALQAGDVKITSSHSNLKIRMAISPEPAKAFRENDLRITVLNASGQAISDARVSVVLSMAEMDHGDLQSEAVWEEGQYVAKVVPVMIGKWIADVTVETGNDTLAATYAFQAVR